PVHPAWKVNRLSSVPTSARIFGNILKSELSHEGLIPPCSLRLFFLYNTEGEIYQTVLLTADLLLGESLVRSKVMPRSIANSFPIVFRRGTFKTVLLSLFFRWSLNMSI